jgi:DNA polymerase I-like protein with 3'-5' exonuclease and polymerase domains
MGQEGMPLDTAKLAEHQANVVKWKAEAAAVLTEVASAAGIHKPDKRKKPRAPEPINIDSPKQLAMLLYDHYGLPVVKTAKGGRAVNEDAVKDLTSRVQRGTAKVKGDKNECLKVLGAITDYNHWGHWLDTFLNPPVGESE